MARKTGVSNQTQLQQFLSLYDETIPLVVPLSQELSQLWEDLLSVHLTANPLDVDHDADPILFRFFLSLFAPPPFPRCVLATMKQLRLCLRHGLIATGTPRSTHILILSSLIRFQERLTTLDSQTTPPSTQERRSFTFERYPAWRFHASYDQDSSGHFPPSYEYLSPHLMTKLHIRRQLQNRNYARIVERTGRSVAGLQPKRFAWYVRQARTLIEQFPVALVPANAGSLPLPTSDDLRLQGLPVVRRLLRLFFERRQISRARGHQDIAWKTLSSTEVQSSFLADDISDSVHRPVIKSGLHPRDNEVASSAIPDAERQELTINVIPLHPDMERVHTARAILNRSREIARCRTAVPYLYDMRVLQLSTLADLIGQLPLSASLESTSDINLIQSTITLTVLLTGQSPASVLTMSVSSGNSPSEAPIEQQSRPIHLTYLPDSHELQYFWPERWLGYAGKKDLPFLNACQHTTRDIRIPLPPPLDRLFAECHRRSPHAADSQRIVGRRFFNMPSDGQSVSEQERAVDRWLNTRGSSRQGRVSLQRLSKAFCVQATQRYGLDPVHAAYVSGQFWWHVRSPLQYTAFPADRLHTDYRAIARQFLTELEANAQATSRPACRWEGLFHGGHAMEKHSSGREGGTVWYGSRCVPEQENLQRYFQWLKKAIECLKEYEALELRVWRHNYFTLLAYHAWEYGTVSRPRVIPHINWDRVDLQGRRCLIADKESRYHEERLMVIPQTVSRLFKTLLQKVNPETLALLTEHYGRWRIPNLSELANPFGFFVEVSKKGTLAFRSLSPASIQWVLMKGRYPRDSREIQYPPNVHRHYVRSFLFNTIQSDFEAINYVMSHKHFGFEPYNVYAATDTSVLHKGLNVWLEQCLKNIGIQPVAW